MSIFSEHNEGKLKGKEQFIDTLYLNDIHRIANRLDALKSYHGVRMSIDSDTRRPISTIVELSSNQVHMSSEDLEYKFEQPRMSLIPLVHGKNFFYYYE